MSYLRKGATAFVLCGLLAASFYLRSESLWQTVLVPPEIRADAKEYFVYAFNLHHHGIYSRDDRGLAGEYMNIQPDAVRSPGYPLYLTLFLGSESVGVFLVNVLFSQVVISTLTVAVAFFIFRGSLGLGLSLAAALLTALSPHLVVMTGYLLTETLFCFFLLCAGWSMYILVKNPGWKTGALLGCMLAMASLVRPSLQYFTVIAAVFLLATFKKTNGLKIAAALMLGFLLMISPWTIRNLVTLKKISDEAVSVGSFHHGIYPDFMYNHIKESYGFPYRFDPRAPEIGKDFGSVMQEIVFRFRNDPVEHAVWYLIKKPVAFWSWDIVQGQGDVFVYPVRQTPYAYDPLFQWSRQLMRWLHYPLVGLCWLGCLVVWLPAVSKSVHRDSLIHLRILSLLLIYFTLIHMLAAPFPRYSIPLRPFQYGMAMFTISLIPAYIRKRVFHRTAPVGSYRLSGRRFFAQRSRIMEKVSLSILVPAYNEEIMIGQSLKRLLVLGETPHLSNIQVIIVNDASTDGTRAEIEKFIRETGGEFPRFEWISLNHPENSGKGKAVQTALQHATNEISIIHDADLEYYPKDIMKMLPLFIEEHADAVFGSRFASSEFRRVLMFRHEMGNRLITFLCNLISNLNLTDIETCYKAVRTKLLQSIPLESNDFRIEPELTIKLAKRKAKIYEVPINYSGRTYQEGKKIRWKDGFRAIWAIF